MGVGVREFTELESRGGLVADRLGIVVEFVDEIPAMGTPARVRRGPRSPRYIPGPSASRSRQEMDTSACPAIGHLAKSLSELVELMGIEPMAS
jgi:hypothetical protein